MAARVELDDPRYLDEAVRAAWAAGGGTIVVPLDLSVRWQPWRAALDPARRPSVPVAGDRWATAGSDAPVWLEMVSSGESLLDATQLAAALEQEASLPDAPSWLQDLAIGTMRMALSDAWEDIPGDVAQRAFAAVGRVDDDRSVGTWAALRALGGAVRGRTPLPDGGVLGLDAPSPEAKALLAAAWIERLARERSVVVAVHGGAPRSPWLAALFDCIGEREAAVAVLEGTPVGSLPRLDDADAHAFRRLRRALPSRFATRRAWRVATGMLDPAAVERLRAAGWLHVVDADVLLVDHAAWEEQEGDGPSDALAGVEPDPEQPLAVAHLVDALTRHAVVDDDASAWCAARALAAHGELERAGRLVHSRSADDAQRELAAWWLDPDAPSTPAAGAASSRTTLELAALRADRRPDDAAALARDAVRASALADPHAAASEHLAAARVLLAIGDVDGCLAVLASDADRWLPEEVVRSVRSLQQWRERPGVVSRAVEVMAGLDAIALLRSYVPGSIAVVALLVARLELLERLGRSDTADDTEALAAEVLDRVPSGDGVLRTLRCRALLAASLAARRRGDDGGALAILARRAAPTGTGDDHERRLRVAEARCLLALGRLGDAHAIAHDLLASEGLLADGRDAASEVGADTRALHGEVLLAEGHAEAAADELAAAVAWRAQHRGPFDEPLLEAMERRAEALAGIDRIDESLALLDLAVARRRALDFEDAPRLLVAQHRRAAVLLRDGRIEDAMRALDEILAHRLAANEPDAAVVVNARADRAACVVMLGDFAGALPELDAVIASRSARLASDDALVLVARQQRVACLLGIGRPGEARAEAQSILHLAAERWDPSHPMLRELRSLVSALDTG